MRDKIVGNIFPLQLGLDIASGCCPAVVVVVLVAVVAAITGTAVMRAAAALTHCCIK